MIFAAFHWHFFNHSFKIQLLSPSSVWYHNCNVTSTVASALILPSNWLYNQLKYQREGEAGPVPAMWGKRSHFWRKEWMCWVASGVTAGIEGNLFNRKANKCLRAIALEKEKIHKNPNNKKSKTKKPWKNGTHKKNPQLPRTVQAN